MKRKSLWLLLAGFIAISSGYGQNQLITATWKNAGIGEVKRDIEKQTPFKLWPYERDTSFSVTLSVKDLPLKKVLDTLFKTRDLIWEIIDSTIAVKARVQKTFILRGKITNSKNEGLSFASITIKGTTKTKECDSQGNFFISHSKENFTIIISMTGYYSKEMRIRGNSFVSIKLDPIILSEVSVAPSKEPPAINETISPYVPNSKTGSIIPLDSPVHNWAPSRNILDVLPSLMGAVLVNQGTLQLNQSKITIRNRITINGNPHTLIILNGFVFSGDLNSINPHDMESISIMKDAAATSQWGMQAGNGVIMITTRHGVPSTAPKVSAKANITVGIKPDLFYLHSMPSADHIAITKMLYQNGYYANIFQNAPSTIIPPAAEILYRQDRGLLTGTEADAALNDLANTDTREEAMKYLYQRSLHQQYHLGVLGGTSANQYYFSLGYDNNKFQVVGNDDTRLTMNLSNTIKLGKNAPEVHFGLYLSQGLVHNNGFDYREFLYPYEKLKDELGNALPVTQTIRQGFKDSVVSMPLLDWNYKPVDDIRHRNNKLTRRAFMLTTGLRYKIGKKLEANVSQRYEKDVNEQVSLHTVDSYFARNLINQFTQIDAGGNPWRPIPFGDILDENTSGREAQNIIAQIKFDAIKRDSSTLTFNIGSEIRHLNAGEKKLRRYNVISSGYSANLNYETLFPMFYEPGISNTIPYVNTHPDTAEHFYSYYANGMYTWKNRFAASFSIRKDESNIFGVQANQKGVPLISAGFSWDISQEPFYHSKLFSQLRLRLSNGYCGNVSSSFSALTGIQVVGTNPWALPYSIIINAPNPVLSPETVRISNIGLDFSLLNNSIWGSAEYFEKEASNLLGLAPIDPTSGVSIFQGNVAAMKGHGIEFALNSKFGNRTIQWQSFLLMSYVRDKITSYSMTMPAIWYYCDPGFLNPKEGKPLYSIYSLDFRGLDAANGDPIGTFNDSATKNYSDILQSSDFNNLIYHGPATPVFYGSFRNTFTWKHFELGFTITWKAGYYFRRNSVRYVELFNGQSIGHADITRRWMAPGDERHTDIPSLQFPGNFERDQFFNYSSALVEKGDHIRLQDIRLKYNLDKNRPGRRFRPATEAFIYANNIGLLWKANKKGIDPDYVNSVPAPLNITMGIKIDF